MLNVIMLIVDKVDIIIPSEVKLSCFTLDVISEFRYTECHKLSGILLSVTAPNKISFFSLFKNPPKAETNHINNFAISKLARFRHPSKTYAQKITSRMT